MTTYRHQPGEPYEEDASAASRINAGRLWSGGVAAAVIAAGLAIVGYLIVKGLLELPILGVDVDGAVAQPGMFTYALISALAALLATGVMHLLLLGTPRPFLFFGWIVALGTIIAMLIPLLAVDRLATGAATAAVNLVIGIAIGALVGGSARASLRVPVRPDPADPFAPRPGL
ncbi:DUF6069 family protein [Phytomonospora sp. NPDC050363]|uniref:DUF6069 family protein n=1 Tax=Phytomonospora sp. NPDC050363 TaxID=3155642 RepID=UPI0033C0FDC7